MNEIRKFLKRLWQNHIFSQKSKDELFQMLKRPDPETMDLLFLAYHKQINDASELMTIVYDDNCEFPDYIKVWAGKAILKAINRQSLLFWADPRNTRVSCLLSIRAYLPQLSGEVDQIAEQKLCRREQRIYCGV